jgi:DNA-binding CsgD family transcriptional regulator
MRKTVVWYGASLAALIMLLKIMQYHFFTRDLSIEFYLGLLAILFTAIGIWVGLKITKPRRVSTPDSLNFEPDVEMVRSLNVSKRELDVLELMSAGLSNQEIADKLFVSLNTVKTHSSNIFTKLDVKRRTQAIQKARQLRLVR